jgi:TolB-like protein/tRNA A-37 threonylcarbamoyl transferase component Bud32/Tfp pilus assembly protein PilF
MNKELAASTTLSHYRIVSKLGAGGMGEVYLAEDTRLRRKVALKVLPADLASNKDRMRRFEQEAIAAAALNHPNIAHIYEVGEHDETHFIAMEFIDGQTLNQLIHHSQADITKLLRHLQHVAEGLAKAHAAGIVHRDLKPDNIMVSRDGHAKILDFGLAKLIEQQSISSDDSSGIATAVIQQHSSPGSVMGTVGYMSPEQALGKTREIDQRSDIFSFGCILYEAVTGKKAFEGKDAIDSLNRIIREPAALITDYRPDAPDHLQRIVRRCLAKDREDRYQTIKDVAIELRELRSELAAGAGIDVSVPPARSDAATSSGLKSTSTESAGTIASGASVSSAEYVVTGIKRHKLAAAGFTLLLIALAVGAGFYLNARNSEVAIESIAVLPFENRSNNSDADYISDGITESINNSLTRLPNLKVIPNSIASRYKGRPMDAQAFGSELRVNAVLVGRVIQRGDNLMISVELDDVRDGKQLWGEQYDRKVADLLGVKSEIAREVSQRLRSQLSGEDQQRLKKGSTENPEAYQLYLRGRFYWNKRTADGLKQSADYYKQAIEKDPSFALAYSAMADAYVLFPNYSAASPKDSMPQAKAAALKALELDDSLAEPHAALGTYLSAYSWDQFAAEREIRRAIELKPNYATAYHWLGCVLAFMNRGDEALAAARRAEELDPLSLIISADTAYDLILLRRYDEAIAQVQRTLTLDPNFYYAHYQLASAYYQKGMYQEAISECRKALELNESPPGKALLIASLARSGGRAEALKLRDELKSESLRGYVPSYFLAVASIALGERDQAFTALEKDFVERSSLYSAFAVDPLLDDLRGDPRFADLTRRVASAKID